MRLIDADKSKNHLSEVDNSMESIISQLKLISQLKTDKYGLISTKFTRRTLVEFIDYLEELKALRVELEKNSKELEIYKKALELVEEECSYNIGYHIVEQCLQKAMGEEE